MAQREYYINYTRLMGEFLKTKSVNHFVTDADIICIRLEGWNDSPFVMLLLEFAEFLIDNENDMSVNPQGDGSKYHSGAETSSIGFGKQFLN